MKKRIIAILTVVMAAVGLVACSEASRVEYNVTKEADNFNVVRELTVINCLQGDVLFQMTGKMSIEADWMMTSLKLSIVTGKQIGRAHV